MAYETLRHLAVGALAGVFYCMLHRERGFPDSVMAVVVGYFGPDVVQGMMERLRRWLSAPGGCRATA